MSDTITISRIPTETMHVPIVGTSPLITHRFSEKAKRKMLDGMQGHKAPKEPKDPQVEYLAAAYRFADGGYGMPAIAFKAATVSAARFFDKSVSMVIIRQSVFIDGELGEDGQKLVRLDTDPVMREDVVTVGRGGSDLRYRPQFTEWSTHLMVTYTASVLNRDSVLSLIDAGGMGVGVGEWRPERSGDFGTYQVDPSREVEIVR